MKNDVRLNRSQYGGLHIKKSQSIITQLSKFKKSHDIDYFQTMFQSTMCQARSQNEDLRKML